VEIKTWGKDRKEGELDKREKWSGNTASGEASAYLTGSSGVGMILRAVLSWAFIPPHQALDVGRPGKET